MFSKNISYQCDHTNCQGFLAFDSSSQKKMGGILISSTWFGCNEFAKEIALEMASLGYVAFAIDLYGDGKVAKNEEEAASLMAPLFQDRILLQKRLIAAYETLTLLPEVDNDKIGAIGFCFGGLSVLELLKSGKKLRGVVSVHGAFHEGDAPIKHAPEVERIEGSLLILTGANDPIATMADLERVQKEMSKAQVDWQTHIFGSAGHSFTNREANKKEAGYYYDPIATSRSFKLIKDFFKEIF